MNQSVRDLPAYWLDRESEQEKPAKVYAGTMPDCLNWCPPTTYDLEGWPAVIREPYEPTVTPEPKIETDETYQ